MKKHRSERKARRSSDTAIEYGAVAIIATEKTRTAESAVRATCFEKMHSERAEGSLHGFFRIRFRVPNSASGGETNRTEPAVVHSTFTLGSTDIPGRSRCSGS